MPSSPVLDWAAVDEFVKSYQDALGPVRREIEELLEKWDGEWESAGFEKDPTHRDWGDFQPVQSSRENGCSDWLAFLLKASKTGVLGWRLFRQGEKVPEDYATPKAVERELRHRGHQCDLLIEWQDGSFAHMEVKTGDPELEKTPKTGLRMRDLKGADADDWSNFILLLSSQLDDWNKVVPIAGEPPTEVRTWVDVSIAVRQEIRGGEHVQRSGEHVQGSGEDALWTACAYMFVGAVEQGLVGYLGYSDEPFNKVLEKRKILKEGWRRE